MKARLNLSTLGKLGIGLLLSLTVIAAEPTTTNERVFIPKPPKAKQPVSAEQHCVEPIDDIRRNHGQYLKHHRDDTVHSGVRTSQYSLIACINCHVTKDAAGDYPSIKTRDHFCRSCHAYAAVTIDCFQCHASHPNE
jgi:hypothetical protein